MVNDRADQQNLHDIAVRVRHATVLPAFRDVVRPNGNHFTGAIPRSTVEQICYCLPDRRGTVVIRLDADRAALVAASPASGGPACAIPDDLDAAALLALLRANVGNDVALRAAPGIDLRFMTDDAGLVPAAPPEPPRQPRPEHVLA